MNQYQNQFEQTQQSQRTVPQHFLSNRNVAPQQPAYFIPDGNFTVYDQKLARLEAKDKVDIQDLF